MIWHILAGIIGVTIGAGGVYGYYRTQVQELTIELKHLHQFIKTESEYQTQMKEMFQGLAAEAMAQSLETLASQAESKLIAAGQLISQDLLSTKTTIGESVRSVSTMLTDLTARTAALAEGQQTGTQVTQQLLDTTQSLAQILSSSQARGQWGERMVEDILQLMGMVDGMNYLTQNTIPGGERPDYTFLLPNDKKIHMDVKFPLAQYMTYLDTEDTGAQAIAKKGFLNDVRSHVKVLDGRQYINPADDTVEYMMMFIPNEAITAFIHANDPKLMDFAMEKGILLCSPITLYMLLSLMNSAIKSFAMAAQTGEILALLEEFYVQWGKYSETQTKMGESLEQAQRRFQDMSGTRDRQLGKIIDKMRSLEKPQITAGMGGRVMPAGVGLPPPPPITKGE